MPQAKRSPKRGLLTRILSGFLLLIVLGASLAGGWLRSEDFQRRAKAELVRIIERETGEHFYVDRIQIGLLPPAIVFQQPRLQHHDDEEVIVRAEELRAPFVFRNNRPAIGTVHLIKPFLEINIDRDGKLKEFQRRVAPKNPTRLTELPWGNLSVVDGSFSVRLPTGSIDISDFNLTPTAVHTGYLSLQVDLAIGPFSDSAFVQVPNLTTGPREINVPHLLVQSRAATVTGFGNYPVGGELNGTIHFQTQLDDYTAFIEPPRAFRGDANIDAHITGHPSDLKVGLTGHVEELSIDSPGVLIDVVRYDLGDASIVAQLQRDGARVENLTLDWGSLGSITAWGSVDRDFNLTDGHILAEGIALSHLLRNLDAAYTPWVDMNADVEIVASGPLKPLQLDGNFDLAISDLSVANGPLLADHTKIVLAMSRGHAMGSINVDTDGLVLKARSVVLPRSSGDLVASIGFRPRGPLDVRINLVNTDLRDVAPMNDLDLRGKGSLTGRIWGPFNRLQFEGYGDLRDFSVAGIPYADRLIAELRSPNMKSLILENARATKGASHYGGSIGLDFKPTFSMRTDLELHRGRVEDILGMFIDLEGVTGNMVEA